MQDADEAEDYPAEIALRESTEPMRLADSIETVFSCRYDEPGAWYAMLPLEIVYAFDPIPPPPPEYLTLADTPEPRSDRCPLP